MRNLDFSSWQGVLASVLGLAVFALIGVGIRVVMMLTIQQRQQRMNRQINERLKTLISAYRTLGGSFTGQLTVDPLHLRDLRVSAKETESDPTEALPDATSDRPRRIRDAVEAALSDILLLGTQEHVRLAAQAANDMAAGRPIHTAELVISLRNYIRIALDLDAIPDTARSRYKARQDHKAAQAVAAKAMGAEAARTMVGGKKAAAVAAERPAAEWEWVWTMEAVTKQLQATVKVALSSFRDFSLVLALGPVCCNR